MSLIIVEPIVKQHRHLYLRLAELTKGLETYNRRFQYEANSNGLLKKVLSFDLVPLIFRRNGAYLFVASEFQHLLVFPILRLLGKEVLFICHEPNLWFGGIGNYSRAVINFVLQWSASIVFVFDKELADRYEKYQYISLWNEEKENITFSTKKIVLSFGSETSNKNIRALDFDWLEYDFRLIRAGRTNHLFLNKDVDLINSFIDDDLKDRLYRESSISILPYFRIEQSMVLLEAMSYGHIVILNGRNTSWKKYHNLDFIFVYWNEINEALLEINALAEDDFVAARVSSLSFFKEVNGKEIFEILSYYK